MNLFESIRFLREKLRIPQGSMIKGMSNTTYSRIENGQRNLKFETIQEISQKFDMTISEVLLFSDTDTEFLNFKHEMATCLENIYDIEKKEYFLNKYFPKGLVDSFSQKELGYYLCIKAIFCTLWAEITPPNAIELEYICEHLRKKTFYTMQDYRVVVNIIMFLNDEQVETVIHQMYPIEFYEKRPELLKTYARHIITNLISSYIYKLEYNKALYYVDFIEKNFDFNTNYYFRLVIAYHKNVALRFAERELSYFDEARDIVNVIAKISDPLTGKQFTEELNNLSFKADYYINLVNYPRTIIKE